MSVYTEFVSWIIVIYELSYFIIGPTYLISLFGRSCLNHPDRKIVAYSSMILFTSLNSERMKGAEEKPHIIDVVEAHQKQPESEWP